MIMINICCPLCGEQLTMEPGRWHCPKNHSFDVARQGYVNLLPVSQKHSKMPGDTRTQVAARKDFLDRGHYRPIAEKMAELVGSVPHESLLDVGCGEGYYLTELQKSLTIPDAAGVDISKDAVRYASVRNKNALFLTATASRMPFEDAAFDIIISMFSLTMAGEYRRLLKPEGTYIRVTAGEDHLPGLKSVIYPEIHEKETKPDDAIEGFLLQKVEELRFDFTLNSNDAVMQLLMMTPHWMRITEAGLNRARETACLQDRASVRFAVYTPEIIE